MSMEAVLSFLDSEVPQATLGLVYGRRRIGKSTLLSRVASDRGGFYWEATRTASAVHLARLGGAIGAHLGTGPLQLDDWDDAVRALLRLGSSPIPVVIDEFGHVLEADPSVASVIASALGPDARQSNDSQARLILCGSAIAMMQSLTSGQAPLRGRAGLELLMRADDHRQARRWLDTNTSLALAMRLYCVIGGVVGYATDMVDHDLPVALDDVDRWIAQRVLSPAATLHHEATTLLAEDPTVTHASNPALYHAVLGSIARGSQTAGSISSRVRRPVSNLAPILNRLVDAGFVVRHDDPIRSQRPTYALADPFLQFHYAVLEPHTALLRDRDVLHTWQTRLTATFDAQVKGPVFEEVARDWVRRYAADETLGGMPTNVGPSEVTVAGVAHQLDVVVADGQAQPSDRQVLAIGEAKSAEILEVAHLQRLEHARTAYGARAADARLLLFGQTMDRALAKEATSRDDVELVDLQRLYTGD